MKPHWLDIGFGHGSASGDIGSPPDPKEKFPSPEDFAHILAYYDGIDVTSDEGRRQWQRETIDHLLQRSGRGVTKVDKLPKSLTQDQAKAISEAHEDGQRVAVATGEMQDGEVNYLIQKSF